MQTPTSDLKTQNLKLNPKVKPNFWKIHVSDLLNLLKCRLLANLIFTGC